MFCYNFLKRVGRITIIRDEIIFLLSPLLIINIHIFSRDMKKNNVNILQTAVAGKCLNICKVWITSRSWVLSCKVLVPFQGRIITILGTIQNSKTLFRLSMIQIFLPHSQIIELNESTWTPKILWVRDPSITRHWCIVIIISKLLKI